VKAKDIDQVGRCLSKNKFDIHIKSNKDQYTNDMKWLQKACPEVFARRDEQFIMEFSKIKVKQENKQLRENMITKQIRRKERTLKVKSAWQS
jgi:tRNA G37 N-methylase TrmD